MAVKGKENGSGTKNRYRGAHQMMRLGERNLKNLETFDFHKSLVKGHKWSALNDGSRNDDCVGKA